MWHVLRQQTLKPLLSDEIYSRWSCIPTANAVGSSHVERAVQGHNGY